MQTDCHWVSEDGSLIVLVFSPMSSFPSHCGSQFILSTQSINLNFCQSEQFLRKITCRTDMTLYYKAFLESIRSIAFLEKKRAHLSIFYYDKFPLCVELNFLYQYFSILCSPSATLRESFTAIKRRSKLRE